MRILLNSSDYLKNQMRKNLVISLFLFSLVIIISFVAIQLEIYRGFLVLSGAISIIPALLGYIYWGKYQSYKIGWEGEKAVTRTLQDTLSDEFILINDVILPPYNRGNIDSIILSPLGILVIETKNHRGTITCYGDEWVIWQNKKGRNSERIVNYSLGSPSAQVRNNIFPVKKIIDSLPNIQVKKIWVQGVVVFANKDVVLRKDKEDLLPDKIEVKYLNELSDYVKNYRDKELLPEERELIASEIVRLNKR